jgi:Domain of unknown function (DUF4349)
MSQLDLARTLREARPVAPPELRERVRLVAAQASPPRRQVVTWRRAVILAATVGVAIAAGVIATRPGDHVAQQPLRAKYHASVGAAQSDNALTKLAPSRAAIAPNTHRVQRYTASLELRVRDAADISDASKRAIGIAHKLGGYEQRINVDTARTTGYASIVLRIPKQRVQEAVRRLTALGTIVSEDVQVQDLQGPVDASDRLIARLQQRLADLRAEVQDSETMQRIAALTARIERLQRSRAATLRSARYATVNLQLTTRTPPAPVQHGHGPLHGLGVTFHWIGIGAVYALALGVPAALLVLLIWSGARTVRRRREDALLSRS